MVATQRLQKHSVHKRSTVEKSLRELVATLGPGDRLPPLPVLRRHFGVAAGTVQAAVEVLSREGLVVRRHGAGTFVADIPAATPRSPQTRTLAVFASLASAYFLDCVEHLVPQAAEQGLAVECRYADYGLTLEDVLRYEAMGVDAFLALGAEMEWVAAAMMERGHRAVVLGEPPAGRELKVPAAFSDAERGGYLATRHLLEQGHRRLAYLPIRTPEWLRGRRRWHGHLRALREAGLDADAPRVAGGEQLEDWFRDPGAARDYFAAPGAPTAVVAWTDSVALKLLGALQRAGIRVPDDVSIIGYDNLPAAAHCWPPLDSVDQHRDLLARHALYLLSLPTAGQSVSAAHVTPTVVCRGSCRRPADS